MDRYLNVFVFCGYGAFLKPELSMKEYLDEGIHLCNHLRPNVVIFTGGCSRMKTLPGRSEAESMLQYAKPKLTYQPILILEEQSLTTLDNVRNSYKELPAWRLNSCMMSVTFWCDASRKSVIQLVGRPIFEQTLWVRASRVKLIQDSFLKNSFALAVTWAASKSSFINHHFRQSRLQAFAKL